MGTLSKGYAGNILRINVSNGTVRIEPLSDELARLFIGGRGGIAYFKGRNPPFLWLFWRQRFVQGELRQ